MALSGISNNRFWLSPCQRRIPTALRNSSSFFLFIMKPSEVSRSCPVCSTLYRADPARLKHGRQTTCSRSCSYEYRRKKLCNSETRPCAVCSTPVSRSPSQIKTRKIFLCSRECHYRARTLGLVTRNVIAETTPSEIPFNRSRQSPCQSWMTIRG